MKILERFFSFIIRNKLLFLLLGFGGAFLFFNAYLYENKIFALHFVDEEDNFALGRFLLKGERLYSDLFSHHQPLGYIISAAVQQLTEPNSIYLLIKRHREFMILYSTLWSIFLIYRFRFPLLLFIMIFEPVKYLLLGDLFLSESLSAYPLIYLCVLSITKWVKLSRVEAFFFGLSLSTLLFLLAPLWPAVLLILSILLLKNKAQIKKLLVFGMLGFFPPLLISLFFLSLPDYFYNVFIINFKYYIPQSAVITKENSPLYALFAPILAFIGPYNDGQSLWVIRTLVTALLFNCFFLIRNKKILLVGSIFILLTLINLRFIRSGSEYYSGFHLLPWFAALTLFSVITFNMILEQKLQIGIKILAGFFVTAAIVLSFGISSKFLLNKNDINRDYYVNYSQFFDSGEAIRIMKKPNETLFVSPDGWLVYWQSDINHASKMINYYEWMTKVPELNLLVSETFKLQKPTYFYCDCPDGTELRDNLMNYQSMKKDSKDTKLYVLKGKLETLDLLQKRQLEFLNYQIN